MVEKKIYSLLVTLALWGFLLLVSSCDHSTSLPDISEVDVAWRFVPFHKNQSKKDSTEVFISQTLENHPAFGNIFFSNVLPVLNLSTEDKKEVLEDYGFTSLVDTCSHIYSDISELEEEFDKAFKYYSYYTSDKSIPNVYTFVSGFAYQNFVFQDGNRDGLGIGLDMYIGSNFPYKSIDPKNPAFSQFLTQYFDKRYILRKSLLAWIDDKIEPAQTGQLAEIIIRNGKIIYLLEKILPLSPKDIILEFQPDEYQWCLMNEPELWTHLLKNNLLFSNQFTKINKLVNPAPNAPGIPPEAPGGVANYIGWRIVQDYMQRSKVSVAELLTTSEFQKILDVSKYRPRVRKD
ncbi:MAG: hypothetical protein P8M34_06780 [Saprospiraceae bacterium]|nr:hypothetical protein [Saprospiraceae bacterium]|tara:strand:+ start:682 stop:1722 length:1041 start_codon:yes stop_codon:yes gene_type:complete